MLIYILTATSIPAQSANVCRPSGHDSAFLIMPAAPASGGGPQSMSSGTQGEPLPLLAGDSQAEAEHTDIPEHQVRKPMRNRQRHHDLEQ
jgi:hypothetical protein